MPTALDDQDVIFSRAFAAIEDGIAWRAFPGAVVAVTYGGKLVAHRGFGHFTYDSASPAVTRDTVYDLASVTKVIATTAVCMVLYERGRLKLETPLVDLLPEFAPSSPQDALAAHRQAVTVRTLLAHASGLPAYAKLFEHANGREEMLRAACALPLEAIPGTRAEYSDIGFLLLGEAVQRLTGERLDTTAEREVFQPLGMRASTYNSGPEQWPAIPPTEDDRAYRHRVVQGEVQDENAFAFGGVAGHAGVFSNAADVARFAECMLAGGAPILHPETVALFTRREPAPAGTSRALGWDTPSVPSQSGRYFSPRSFGHLGYAGTSLWIDPERSLSVTLLTNRTWPDRSSQFIKQVRPRFHDAIVEALLKM